MKVSMPTPPAALMDRAARCMDERNYQEALDICNQLRQSGFEPPNGMFVRGLAHYNLKQDAEGFQLMEEAVKKLPHPDMLTALGIAYQERNLLQEAMAVYQRLMAVRPDKMPAPEEAIYNECLEKTNSAPFPIERRARFGNLMRVFEATLQRVPQGTVVECGCFRGLSSRVLASLMKKHTNSFDGTGLILCDSFEGLGQPAPQDAIPDSDPQAARLRGMMQPGWFSASIEKVQRHLSDFPGIRYVKGWIPQSLSELPADAKYRFLNIDVDMYEPTAGALAYFWPKMLVGGVAITDDYNWPGCRKAIDDFAASLPKGSFRFQTNEYAQAWFEKLA